MIYHLSKFCPVSGQTVKEEFHLSFPSLCSANEVVMTILVNATILIGARSAGRGAVFGVNLVAKGRSCARIRTKQECEEAARTLGLPVTTATAVPFGHRYPPFCYYKPASKGLKFNAVAGSSKPCHSSRQCLCRTKRLKGWLGLGIPCDGYSTHTGISPTHPFSP